MTLEDLSPVKRALLEIRELRARLATLEAAHPIAIVGLGLRMPGGVVDAPGLAHLLWSGVDAVGPIPADRWDLDALYNPDPDASGGMITRDGGFLDGIDLFDENFFGISPREAASMDPQQRLLLEVCWHALEDAGYANDALEGSRTGVYVGVSNSDYARLVWQRQELIDAYSASGGAFSVLAGRVSYFLGLRGPSLAVDTACSSSLVALHLACQGLRTGECDMALAGGINLILSPEFNIAFTKARMMAPDGRCKTFDSAADGFVRGEGIGVLVLKRLTDAQAAGDRILAVVHGSAVNQDGSSNGLTAPNGPAQEAVIRAALAQGGITPAEISYVEAHGTGTPLGDPIEVGALAAVFAGDRARETPLIIGSVKTNLGHLEAAAGVAGVIKVILSLQRRAIPPHLHFRTGNPRIDWDELPLHVPRVATEWPALAGRRLAGVSSFGFSGTNAHAVLGEAPAPSTGPLSEPPVPPLAGQFVLPLSARDDAALRELAGRYARWFENDSPSPAALADACHTAGVGRRHFRHRLTIQGPSAEALRSALAAFAGEGTSAAVIHGQAEVGTVPKVAFLFAGDGSTPGDVVRELDAAPAFRRALDDCADLLRPRLELRGLLCSTAPLADPLTGLARFAVDYAIAALWQRWGVEPDCVVGHGMGEIGAACCAGRHSLADALALALAGEPMAAAFHAVRSALPLQSLNRSLLAPAPRSAALEALRARGITQVIEIGPTSVEQILLRLEQLYVAGVPIDWQGVAAGQARRRVPLPLYPFHRRRHWIDLSAPRAVAGRAACASAAHPLLGPPLSMALPGWFYQSRLAADQPGFLGDHVALERVVLPATAYLEMMFAAAADVEGAADAPSVAAPGSGEWLIEDVTIGDAMVMEDGGRLVQTVLSPAAAATPVLEVAISSRREPADPGEAPSSWLRHVTGVLRRGSPQDPGSASLAHARTLCDVTVPIATFYADLAERGLSYGSAFQSMTALWLGSGEHGHEGLGEVVLPADCIPTAAAYRMHPILLDGCLQVMLGILGAESDALFLPIAIGAVRVFGPAPQRCVSHVTLAGSGQSRRGTVRVFGLDGTVAVVLDDVQLRRVSRDALMRRDDRWLAPWLYRTTWRRYANPATPAGTLGPRSWIIVADGGGLADELTARLPGAQLLRGATLQDGTAASPVWSRATDVIDVRPLDTVNGAQAAAGVCALAQTLLSAAASQERIARLWIVTAGGQAVTGAEALLAPGQAASWGVTRTLRLEHPELQTVSIDLDPDSRSGALGALLARLDGSGAEHEIAVRGGECWVSRLVRHGLESSIAAPTEPCRWVPRIDGTFEQFMRQPLRRRQPGAGEVEIAVQATGLNFRDVLNVLGMYPGARPPLGGECAGVVVALGAGVTHLALGQRVLAVAVDSLASHVIARAAMTRAIPPGVGMEEAASFPIAFVTADYCLLEIGRLRAGDRVLVHAGAGGVGMAAVRIAQRVGAEVFATAGSPAKRELLRGIGVAQVFDSRDPGFADALLAASGGRGVDLVLNSLSGDMLDASFRVVARGGRFVEIGKRGIKTPDEVAAMHRDIAYTIVDWSDSIQSESAAMEAILTRLVDALGTGRIAALPRHVFAVDEAPKAFRLMADARHVGRIVLRHSRVPATLAANGGLRRDGTYLVTGGLSGLGLAVAQWLGESGGGRLVLISRRGLTEEAGPVVARLRAAGTDVLTAAVDVADAAALAALLARLRHEGPPLRGVVHAAAVLDDAAILTQTAEHFERVLAPKLGGAEALDRLTRADPLDFLVFFSSIAAVLGARGQANYAAANLALDLVASRRRRDGLAAMSISWGAWSGTGLAANARTASWLDSQGLEAMSPMQGLRALERLLFEDLAAIDVAPLDWPRFVERVHAGRRPPFLSEIAANSESSVAPPSAGGRADAQAPLREQLAAAPAQGRRALLSAFLRSRICQTLHVDPARAIDEHLPLGDLGLDSLMAIELRNILSAALERPLSATLLFDHPTIAQLTSELLTDDSGMSVSPGSPKAPLAGELIASVADLSDDEIDLQLAARRRRSKS